MKEAGFKYIEHTADVQAKCWGRTLEEAFEQTAYSLMATLSPALERIKPSITKEIKIKSEDKEALLFDYLSEFLFFFDVEDLIFSKIDVISISGDVEGFQINSIVKGEPFNKNVHEIGTEVKAVTYNFMTIEESENKVEIEIVFDI